MARIKVAGDGPLDGREILIGANSDFGRHFATVSDGDEILYHGHWWTISHESGADAEVVRLKHLRSDCLEIKSAAGRRLAGAIGDVMVLLGSVEQAGQLLLDVDRRALLKRTADLAKWLTGDFDWPSPSLLRPVIDELQRAIDRQPKLP